MIRRTTEGDGRLKLGKSESRGKSHTSIPQLSIQDVCRTRAKETQRVSYFNIRSVPIGFSQRALETDTLRRDRVPIPLPPTSAVFHAHPDAAFIASREAGNQMPSKSPFVSTSRCFQKPRPGIELELCKQDPHHLLSSPRRCNFRKLNFAQTSISSRII